MHSPAKGETIRRIGNSTAHQIIVPRPVTAK
jgi:hypothetical protein